MNKLLVPLIVALSIGSYLVGAQTPSRTIVKTDPALDALISSDATLTFLGDHFGNTEGPAWVPNGNTGYLVFSDIASNVIWKMTPDGKFSVLEAQAGYPGEDYWNVGAVRTTTEQSNAMDKTNLVEGKDPNFRRMFLYGPNGLAVDKEGRVVVCSYYGRSIYRLEKDGKRTVLADQYEGKKLSGPNDIVVKKDGAIYFSDMAGGLAKNRDPNEPLAPNGIYMIKDGKIKLVIDMKSPNGLAFSQDEKYLYLNRSGYFIDRYEVHSDEDLTNSGVLIDLKETALKEGPNLLPGASDGMRVDSKGNIYTTGPGGIWIVSPQGKHLGTILVPNQTVTNLSFGGPDYKTLYITDRATIYKIQVKTPGNRVF